MKLTVWVLTSEYNSYDQFGEYFEAVFRNKPTAGQLLNQGVQADAVDHVLNGGGREKYESMWWHLVEMEPIETEIAPMLYFLCVNDDTLDDAKVFSSKKDAVSAFESQTVLMRSVEQECTGYIYMAEREEDLCSDWDFRLTVGPRGGIRCERGV